MVSLEGTDTGLRVAWQMQSPPTQYPLYVGDVVEWIVNIYQRPSDLGKPRSLLSLQVAIGSHGPNDWNAVAETYYKNVNVGKATIGNDTLSAFYPMQVLGGLTAPFYWTSQLLVVQDGIPTGNPAEPEDFSVHGSTSSSCPVSKQGYDAIVPRWTVGDLQLFPTSRAASGTSGSTGASGSVGATYPTLRTDGLGVVAFGARERQVVSALTRYLGPPTGNARSLCVSAELPEVEWGDLTLEFSSHSRFVGYRYNFGGWKGLFKPEPRVLGTPSPLLKTSTGATIGATLGQVRSLYQGSTIAENGDIGVTSAGGATELFIGLHPRPEAPVLEIKSGNLCGDF